MGYRFYINGKKEVVVPTGPDRKPIKEPHPQAAGILSGATIVRRATSISKVCGVYFLIAGSRIVYIGQSRRVYERISGHIRKADFGFDAYYVMPCKPGELLKIESRYIKALQPHGNKAGRIG